MVTLFIEGDETHMKRCAAKLVLAVDINISSFYQHVAHGKVASIGGIVQRCVAIIVLNLELTDIYDAKDLLKV